MPPNSTTIDLNYSMHVNSPLDLSKRMTKRSPYSKTSQIHPVKERIQELRTYNLALNWISENGSRGIHTGPEVFRLLTAYLLFCTEAKESSLDSSEFVSLLGSEYESMNESDSGCESTDRAINRKVKLEPTQDLGKQSDGDHVDKDSNDDSSSSDEKTSDDSSSRDNFEKNRYADSPSSYDSGIESSYSGKLSDDDDFEAQSDNEYAVPKLMIDCDEQETKPTTIRAKTKPLVKKEPDADGCQKDLPPIDRGSLVTAIIKSLVNLEKFRKCECYDHGSNLTQVFLDLLKKDMLGDFLTTFTHCFTCRNQVCSKLCFMFKRIIVHITASQQHECAVKHVYSHILRIHLETCREQKCLLPNCSQLKEKRMIMAQRYYSSSDRM